MLNAHEYFIEEECSTIINTTTNSLTKARYQPRGNISDFNKISKSNISKNFWM